MKPEIERAMREVLEAWESPTSSSGLNLACAIYQMKQIYMAEVVANLNKPKRGKVKP
jgi:hypothetical protein